MSDFNFEYNLKQTKFDDFRYHFTLIKNMGLNENLGHSIEDALKKLEEKLIIPFYSGKFEKTYDADIDKYAIRLRWFYDSQKVFNKEGSFRVGAQINLAQYRLTLLDLSLLHSDTSENVLRFFDKVIGLDDLTISDEAKINIDRVNYLRKSDFTLNNYLAISEKSSC